MATAIKLATMVTPVPPSSSANKLSTCIEITNYKLQLASYIAHYNVS